MACVSVIAFVSIFGITRNIPFFEKLIVCKFGVIGIISPWLARKYIKKIVWLEFNGSEGERQYCLSCLLNPNFYALLFETFSSRNAKLFDKFPNHDHIF